MHASSAQFERLPHPGSLRTDLGLALVGEGVLTIAELAQLRETARTAGKSVPDLLLAAGRMSEDEMLALAGRSMGLGPPPDGGHIDATVLADCGKAACRALGFVMMISDGGMPLLVLSKPWNYAEIVTRLPDRHKRAHACLINTERLEDLLRTTSALGDLTDAESCRGWNVRRIQRRVLAAGVVLLATGLLVPSFMLLTLTAIALFAMCAVTFLKTIAAVATLTDRPGDRFATRRAHDPKEPLVSLLVPLYREKDIAGRLVSRLLRLERSAELLEVLLVVENDDQDTLTALQDANLPPHFRIVVVPDGPVRTKPHAMNHAVGFARGDIIGIYDAEDQPDPRQISAVIQAFARAAPNVACVQGQLDFYNTGTSWLTRAFTLDYAAWFRIVLPGLARLGLVVPLGGTTLFFRRDALERLGGWDAWNVTEDADLGLRLARHGWRCEVVCTTTHEEAVARPMPWIRQRSRWQKGYATTWATHMREPVALWRDLGTWRFAAVQVQFLMTLLQSVMAPLLWSFWLIALTDVHPLEHLLSYGQLAALFWLFLTVTVLDAAVLMAGLIKARKLHLWPMIPLMQFYFLMSAIAAYRGLIELLIRPYHWDKTSHGTS